MDLIIYCDGACRGNPGPMSYGGVVYLSDGTEIGRGGTFLGHGTNNTAEWKAAIAGLRFARDAVSSENTAKIAGIVLRMDSLLVIRQLSGQWKIKEPRLKEFYREAQGIMGSINIPIQFEWIPREQNSEADRIANHFLDIPSSNSPRLEYL